MQSLETEEAFCWCPDDGDHRMMQLDGAWRCIIQRDGRYIQEVLREEEYKLF